MKHFLKCHSITDAHKKPDLQGSKSSKLQGSGESGTKSKKDKGDKCMVMRRKVTSHVGQSPKLVAKRPLRSRSKRVHIVVCALLGPAAGSSQEDVGKAPHSHQSHKKSKKHGKKSHKKSCH